MSEVTERPRRRRKHPQDDVKEGREYRKLNEGAVDSAVWKIRFRRV